MRVHAFRMWFGATLRQGVGAARRAGLAVSRRVRASLGKIEGATGIGDEDTALSRGGSRAWWSAVEEAATKLRDFLEKSTFVRIGKLEAWVRTKLGLPPRVSKTALAQASRALPAPPRPRTHGPGRGSVPLDPEQAARLRAQVQLLRTQANTSRGRAPASGEPAGPDPYAERTPVD